MIRQGALDWLRQAREVLLAGACGLVGLWLAMRGGYLFTPLGLILAALGGVWAVLALRRLRFGGAGGGPGLVEVDEAQVGYLGPDIGGFVSLDELTELRLIRLRGVQHWRLKQKDGQALLIPVAAAGAERLFDAFAALPGMDTGRLVAALEVSPSGAPNGLALQSEIAPVIWQRPVLIER